MKSGLTVLIVGGYGTFGGRIVELLENEPRLFRVEISPPHRPDRAVSRLARSDALTGVAEDRVLDLVARLDA
jgi:hypothetical protein